VKEVWALGDNLNDLAMLKLADRGFVIDPKSPALVGLPGVQVVASFDELAALLPQPLAAAA
ncbi:MAG: HAD hydrolase family protein, partial [Rubrivivax sp.]|nr:HAD hydrolase family protein [Rubrivivax sp.]